MVFQLELLQISEESVFVTRKDINVYWVPLFQTLHKSCTKVSSSSKTAAFPWLSKDSERGRVRIRLTAAGGHGSAPAHPEDFSWLISHFLLKSGWFLLIGDWLYLVSDPLTLLLCQSLHFYNFCPCKMTSSSSAPCWSVSAFLSRLVLEKLLICRGSC